METYQEVPLSGNERACTIKCTHGPGSSDSFEGREQNKLL